MYKVERRRAHGVDKGFRNQRGYYLDDDTGGDELRDAVAREVAHVERKVGADLNASLLATLHGDAGVGHSFTGAVGFEEAEKLRQRSNVELIRHEQEVVDGIGQVVGFQEETRDGIGALFVADTAAEAAGTAGASGLLLIAAGCRVAAACG